jgi:hypothetical protein
MSKKIFVVEFHDVQSNGDSRWCFEDFFYEYEVADGYIESQIELTPELEGRMRITSYVPEGAKQTKGEVVDYSLAEPCAERLKKPLYHLTTPYDEEWAVVSQNPYAFAAGNGIVNE